MDAERLVNYLLENDDEDELSTKEFMKAHGLDIPPSEFAPLLRWINTGELEVSARIYRSSSHYVHENTISSEVEHRWYPSDETAEQYPDEEERYIGPLVDKLSEAIQEDARSLSQDIYRSLEQEHDHLTSEETIVDSLDANEFLFTEEGDDFDDSGLEKGEEFEDLPGELQQAILQRHTPDMLDPDAVRNQIISQGLYYDLDGNVVEKTWFFASELDDSAKQRVCEKHYDWNVHDQWWDFVYDLWKERLEERGYNDIDIRFSGFSSQGDGASFTGSVDVEKWIKQQSVPKSWEQEQQS